jgi:Methyltransferase domain
MAGSVINHVRRNSLSSRVLRSPLSYLWTAAHKPPGPPSVLKALTAAKVLARRYLGGIDEVSRLLRVQPSAIRVGMREYYLREIGALSNVVARPDEHKAALLFAVCKVLRPRVVVETGVASGHSSRGILSALDHLGDGQLFSIDLPGASYVRGDGRVWSDGLPDKGTGSCVPQRLRSRWNLRLGPSREILPRLVSEIGPVDLFYHDSEHTWSNVMFELETVFDHLGPSSVIAVDNVDWSSAFVDFSSRYGLPRAIAFPEFGFMSTCQRSHLPPITPSHFALNQPVGA